MTFPLPPAGGYAPINSLEAARTGAARRGKRISSVLFGLLILQLFFAVLSLGGAALSLVFLSGSIGKELPSVGKVPQLGSLLGLGGLYVLIILVAQGLYIYSILMARRAVMGVQRYAADPAHQGRPDARGFTRWLTFWQWYMLVGSLLGLVIGVALVFFGSLLDSSSKMDAGSQAGVLVLVVFGSLIQIVPTVVLSWLILNAIKRFFLGVEAHASGSRAPLSPVARTVGSWLIFVIVVLGLLLAFVVFYAALLGVLAAIPGTLDSRSASSRTFKEATPLLIGGGVLLTLLIAAVYGLMIAVTAWSRGFALDVAQLLDGGPGAAIPGSGFGPGGAVGGMNNGVDAWRGAVMPPEPPR
ncbi:hypothetical protein [Deinococcus sp.]|uniref:hypothetical protein n=1 Tax=Deinococcus sp. TaxID=47478 RepID=UPI0025FD46DB|nr:hypothetical protein [Deinococcus sp.]